jgi:zinc protease
LENVPIERLQAFYRKYYQPDNAVLVVSGKFDEAKTLALIQERFGAIPKPERSLDKGNLLFPTYTAEPTQDGERLVTLRRTGDVQVMMAAYHVPPGSHEDFAAVEVLADWLGKEPAGPLYKAVVETKKASGVSAGAYQLREPGLLSVVAEVRTGSSLEEAQKAVLKVVEEAALKGPTAEEVTRSKTALLKQFELQMNNPQSVGVGLSEWAAAGDWRLMFLFRDRIEKVTADDVKRVAGKYLKSSNRTLGQFLPTEKPERAEIPAVPDLAVVLKDYKGKAAVSAGEDFVATVENIEARTTRGALSSGVKTAYLPKKTRGGQVRVLGRFRFGSEKSLTGQEYNALFAGQMLMRGTKKHTRQQIQDEFDRLKARAFVVGGGSSANWSVETTRENLIPAMRLIAEILKEPAFDAKEFALLQEETLASYEESLQEPGTLANEALAIHLNPYPKGHPFSATSTREDIAAVKALKLADVKKFHANFYGASSGEIAVVGDFDAKEFNAVLEETLGSWKSPQAFTRIPEKFTSASTLDKDVDVADKANAVVAGALPFKLNDQSSDYPALVLANFLFGGGFLDSRLATRIRQKEGLSYGVGSSLVVSSWEEVAQLGFFAITAPENADKVEKAMREELDLVLKSGFSDDEMKKGKSGYLQSQEQNRVNDLSLAGALVGSLYLGRTLTFQAELEKKINALSKEDVLKAVQKYWVPGAFSVAKAGSFSKPPAASK